MELEQLIKKAKERGIDVEDLLLTALSKSDPEETSKMRLEAASEFLSEMEEYLKEGNAVQASEKAYKVAEELVKALAERFRTPEYLHAVSEGRWTAYDLGKAAGRLAKTLGDWVLSGWSSAYFLHVWGFHEGKLTVEDLAPYVEEIRRMYDGARKALGEGRH